MPALKTLALGIVLLAGPLALSACGSEETELTGTWRGSFNGYTVVGDQAINEGDGNSKITIKVGKIEDSVFTATIAFPVTGAKGTIKTKVPGVVSEEGDEVWMAGANGYYLGQFEDDGLELTYLKSFTIDPSDANGNGIENVAQIGQFERSN